MCKERKCCGEVCEFDPKEHGSSLVSGANGGDMVSKEFDRISGHPLVSEVSRKLSEDQCHSKAIHINYVIRRLIRFYDDHNDGEL